MDLDVTLHGFPLPSFLPRVSHARATQQGQEDYHTTVANTMPSSHPLLVRRSEASAPSQQSGVRVAGGGGAAGSHPDPPADHHGDNSNNVVSMQQFLTSVAGDMGLHGFYVTAGMAGGAAAAASATRPRSKLSGECIG